jgi:hypothetical protein
MLGKDQTKLSSACGAALDGISLTNEPDERKQSTLGGIVEVADKIYGMTVNHLFHVVSDGSQEVGREFEVEEADLESDSDQDSWCNGDGYEMLEDENVLDQGSNAHSTASVCKKGEMCSATSDWTVNMVIVPSETGSETNTIFVTRVNSSAPQERVFVITRRGTIVGLGQGPPAQSAKDWSLPGLSGELWAVQAQNMGFSE